ncbi:hypothetical protein B0H14DRAFT_462937 [Mycena olivaceomarginata]|nr:hypothetical protein B0H14DRAFT_462937 [Mycena olivaceomarginata]
MAPSFLGRRSGGGQGHLLAYQPGKSYLAPTKYVYLPASESNLLYSSRVPHLVDIEDTRWIKGGRDSEEGGGADGDGYALRVCPPSLARSHAPAPLQPVHPRVRGVSATVYVHRLHLSFASNHRPGLLHTARLRRIVQPPPHAPLLTTQSERRRPSAQAPTLSNPTPFHPCSSHPSHPSRIPSPLAPSHLTQSCLATPPCAPSPLHSHHLLPIPPPPSPSFLAARRYAKRCRVNCGMSPGAPEVSCNMDAA